MSKSTDTQVIIRVGKADNLEALLITLSAQTHDNYEVLIHYTGSNKRTKENIIRLATTFDWQWTFNNLNLVDWVNVCEPGKNIILIQSDRRFKNRDSLELLSGCIDIYSHFECTNLNVVGMKREVYLKIYEDMEADCLPNAYLPDNYALI